MKTITVKKTDKGNYITCIEGIKGTQSSENDVMVFNSNMEYLNTVNAHPHYSWVSHCKKLCVIGGVKDYANNDVVSELVRSALELGIEGYTTKKNIESGLSVTLLQPRKYF